MRIRRWIAAAAAAAVLAVGLVAGCAAAAPPRSIMRGEEAPVLVNDEVVRGATTVPVRRYEPAAAPWGTLVWAHGGSFVRGTLDWPEADWAARAFAAAGLRVYSVDYALASDTVKAPAPAADVATVLHVAAQRHEGALFIGGASAGAHLAALAALAQHDAAVAGATRDADALLLLYPTTHRVQRADAAIAARTAALPEALRFDAARIADMYAFYLGDAGASEVVGELPPQRLAALPPTVIINADADDLRASGEQFGEQLQAAGVPVVVTLQPGTVHGYLNRPNESPGAEADARATIARFVAELRAIRPD